MSQLELNCLESWRQWCPDFELKLWNESNFSVEFSSFTQEAYRLGYFAFVSDVARIWVLYHHGGIYLDTDMLLLGPLDQLLSHDFFIGEHLTEEVGVGILGANSGHPLLGKALEFYSQSFFDPNRLILIPNLFDNLLKEHPSNQIAIYPPEYFYPLPFSRRGQDFLPFITFNTLSVHLWNHTWKDEFAYLKEHHFAKSFSLFFRHAFRYPKTYLEKEFLSRYVRESKMMIKQYLYYKIKGGPS